jgi:hypothetical protein
MSVVALGAPAIVAVAIVFGTALVAAACICLPLIIDEESMAALIGACGISSLIETFIAVLPRRVLTQTPPFGWIGESK